MPAAVVDKIRQTTLCLKHYGICLIALALIPIVFWDLVFEAVLLCSLFSEWLIPLFGVLFSYLSLLRKSPLIIINPVQVVFFRGTRQFEIIVVIKVALLLVGYLVLAGCSVALFRPPNAVMLGIALFAGMLSSSLVGWSRYNGRCGVAACILQCFAQIVLIVLSPAASIAFSLVVCMVSARFLFAVRWDKYLADQRLVYRTHAALARGDMGEMQSIAQARSVREGYRISMKGVFGNVLLGKSVFIDTLRASRMAWAVVMSVFLTAWVESYFALFATMSDPVFYVLSASALSTLSNEYAQHARVMRTVMDKGFSIPLSHAGIAFFGTIVPAAAFSLLSAISLIASSHSLLGYLLVAVAGSSALFVSSFMGVAAPNKVTASRAVSVALSFCCAALWFI